MEKRSRPAPEPPHHAKNSADKRGLWAGLTAVRAMAFCATACIAAAAALLLASCQPSQPSQPGPPSPPASGAHFESTSDRPFEVVPFAGGGNAELRSGDGMIVFYSGEGLDYSEGTGMYTSCLFDIEGEGVERFDVVMSQGSLAAAVKEVYVEGSMERAAGFIAAERWPGAGVHGSEDEAYQSALATLGGFDDQGGIGPRSTGGISGDGIHAVSFFDRRTLGDAFSYQPGTVDEATGIDFSRARLNLRLTMGDLAPLMESVPSSQIPRYAGSDHAALDLFNGATLTVTAHFDDGTQARKAYRLSTGWLKCEIQAVAYEEGGPAGNTGRVIFPELFDGQGGEEMRDRVNCIYTVYAVEQA